MRSLDVPTPVDDDGATPRRRVIVLAGGDDLVPSAATDLPPGAQVIAADSGLHLATALGLHVDLLVGDLDSVDVAERERAEAGGTRVERHPVDKDRTDLALALDAAVADGPADITVVGGHGGRLDHLLGGALLLASPRYAASRIIAHMGPATVTVVTAAATLYGAVGDLVSLVPVHGPANGVTTRGLRFPLTEDALPAGSSRGVSNVFAAPIAEVRCTSGVLLAIQPGDHTPTRHDPPPGDPIR